ncbi:MAG: acylneuraminate cytidylyltransferase family protein [Candidatus Yanofskybacteria bacterium]|nr:acylneuraminate cytidylyltransferase family protein [Candidatus Yanofskybacteria bacterium]
MQKSIKNLAIIPARGGSKGIPGKNIKIFHGKPLIAHAIEQARETGLFDRIVVDTEDEKIAAVARKYGAEVPFLRPKELAGDKSPVVDAVLLLLKRLKEEDGYEPDIITLLQTTSPLREISDIKKCWKRMLDSKVRSVCTICDTHPRLYHLDDQGKLILANKIEKESTNRQVWPAGYLLNGCMVYMIRINEFIKTRKFINADTRGVVCPKWRSIDLDGIEDWILAETIFAHKKKIEKKIQNFNLKIQNESF